MITSCLFADFNQALFDEAKNDFYEDLSTAKEKFSRVIDQMGQEEQKAHPEVFFWRTSYFSEDRYEISKLDGDIKDLSFAKENAEKGSHLYRAAKMRLQMAKFLRPISKETTEYFNDRRKPLTACKSLIIDFMKDENKETVKELKGWINKHFILFLQLICHVTLGMELEEQEDGGENVSDGVLKESVKKSFSTLKKEVAIPLENFLRSVHPDPAVALGEKPLDLVSIIETIYNDDDDDDSDD